MLDGVAEQFIAPRTTTLALHHLSFPPFDASHHHLCSLPPPPNLLHHKDEGLEQELEENSMDLEIINEISQTQQLHELIDSSWSNDEVVALLRIRSSMDTWFPHLTWEHVSRKLAEVGFKRSAEKCKHKLEEETRYLNNNISDLEHLYQLPNPNPIIIIPEAEAEAEAEAEKSNHEALELEEVSTTKQYCEEVEKKSKKKRKRHSNKLEMLKWLCEKMVNKMMAQQEQMHKQLLEDMLKREKEKLEREEAWKKQETERMKRELQMMAKEQAIAAQRQATIIEFLKKFSDQSEIGKHNNNNNNLKSASNGSNPNSVASSQNPNNPSSIAVIEKDDVGRRWPREEVVALINLRVVKNNNEGEEKWRGGVWERISEGMWELGYKRSAKRCKEKWENINKYFKKTKDNVSKKRSLHSRTCPYFHQLTTFYTQPNLLHQSISPHTTLMHNHIPPA